MAVAAAARPPPAALPPLEDWIRRATFPWAPVALTRPSAARSAPVSPARATEAAFRPPRAMLSIPPEPSSCEPAAPSSEPTAAPPAAAAKRPPEPPPAPAEATLPPSTPDTFWAAWGIILRARHAASASNANSAKRSNIANPSAAAMACSTRMNTRRNTRATAKPRMPFRSISTHFWTTIRPPGNAAAAVPRGSRANAAANSTSAAIAVTAVESSRRAIATWPPPTRNAPKTRAIVGRRLNSSSVGPSGSHFLMLRRTQWSSEGWPDTAAIHAVWISQVPWSWRPKFNSCQGVCTVESITGWVTVEASHSVDDNSRSDCSSTGPTCGPVSSSTPMTTWFKVCFT